MHQLLPQSAQASKQNGQAAQQSTSVVSPTNNYIDFLQTGSLDMNSGTQRSQDLLSKQNPKSALSVLEETSQLMEGQKKHQ